MSTYVIFKKRIAGRLYVPLLTSFLLVSAATAQDWGSMATISSTMGVNNGRLCMGEGSRGDIGCPTYAPSVTTSGDVSVTGNLQAAKFIGDGSSLTNLPLSGSASDRISTTGVSSGATLGMVVADKGTVSFTLAGVEGAAYLHATTGLVAAAVSTTTGNVQALRILNSTAGEAAGTPGFSWSGDDNTGMFWLGADTLGLTTGGAERLRLSSTGATVSGFTTSTGSLITNNGTLNLNTGAANYWMINKRAESYGASSPNSLIFSYWNGSSWAQAMDITSSSFIGIGTSAPTQRLDVAGNVKATAFIGDGSALTNLPATPTDRLVSGSAGFTLASTGTITHSSAGSSILYMSGAGANSLELGQGRTTNNYAYIDLIGDATYTDYGLRLIRNNTGANAGSWLQHRGTGDLTFSTADAADIAFQTASNEKMRIEAGGNVGIGTSSPQAKLEVRGALLTQSAITVSSTNWAELDLRSGRATANEKMWNIANDSSTGNLRIRALSDDRLSETITNPLVITRGGLVGLSMTPTAFRLEVNGGIRSSGEMVSTFSNNFRIVNGNYGSFWRQDGANLYLMMTASGDQYGGYNSLRPMYVNVASGAVTFGNAVTATNNQIEIQGVSPRLMLTDTDTNYNFWAYNDSGRFYILADRDDNGSWEGPHPLELNATNNTALLFGQTVWTASSDGSGSGLDADLLDGIHASGLLTKAAVNTGNACIGNGTTVTCADDNIGTRHDLTTRVPSGFWQTDTATTGEGWPANGSWYHLLSTTHNSTGNYFSMQFAGDFFSSNNIFYRTTNNAGTTGWSRLWHQSNDGAGSGLDADLLDGLDSTAFLRTTVNQWNTSTDGMERIYFSNGARTYLKGGGASDYMLSLRNNSNSDVVHFASNGDMWSSVLGNWLTAFLNQGVRTDSNPTFNNVYVTALGNWITSFLNQSVRTDASPYFGTASTRTSIGANGSIKLLRTASSSSPDTNGFIDFSKDDTNYARIMYQDSVKQINIMHNLAGGVSLYVQGAVMGNGAYQNVSDARFKKDVHDISYGLTDVMKLRPVTFQWKNQTDKWQQGRKLGLIAQEVQTVLPEVVATAQDTSKTLSIAYGDIVPVLIKSVQELKTENDQLKANQKTLLERLDALEKRVGTSH